MKNLENVVGLQEMSLQEMKDVNGGGIIGAILTQLVIEIIEGTFVSDMKAGYAMMQ